MLMQRNGMAQADFRILLATGIVIEFEKLHI
jgi:hypothetical protein